MFQERHQEAPESPCVGKHPLTLSDYSVAVCVCIQYGADTGATWGVDCGGTTMAGYFGTGLLFSYLLLFINFFAVTYIRARLSPAGKKTQ